MWSLEKVEDRLVDVGNSAFWAVRTIGYVPLSISKNGNLSSVSFKIFSLPVFHAIFLLLITIFWTVVYFEHVRPSTQSSLDYGGTESFAHYSLTSVLSISAFLFKIFGISCARQTVEFWKGTVAFSQMVFARTPSEKLGPSTKEFRSKVLESVRRSLRRSVLFYWCITFAHLFICYTLPLIGEVFGVGSESMNFLIKSGKDSSVAMKVLFFSGYHLWTWQILVHAGHSVWLIFFMKIYRAGFKLVNYELEDLAGYNNKKPQQMTQKEAEKFPIDLNAFDYALKPVFNRYRQPNIIHVVPLALEDSLPTQFPGKDEERLSLAIESYSFLEKEIDAFNSHFGNQLIFELLICIASTSTQLFFASTYIAFGRWERIKFAIGPFLIYSVALYHIASEATSMTQQAKRVLRPIQDLQFRTFSKELRDKLNVLLIRTASNPPTITGSNYFTVNRTLITSVLGAVTTYLIVLVQFQFSSHCSNTS